MSARIDWRKPIQAQAEETAWTDISEGTNQPRRSIRWLLSAEGYGRVHRGEACWDCLTGFPAPLGKADLTTWHASGYVFPFGWSQARRRIRNMQCPLCGAECTDEMLAIQTDDAWQAEDDRLYEGSRLRVEDEREREEHADSALIERLGLRDPLAPPARAQSMKRKGES